MVIQPARKPTTDKVDALHLTIDRCACQYNIPAGIDSVAAVRDRLTRIMEKQVPQICGSIVTSLPGDDEAVYRIRHLHLELWVDLQGMSEAEIAQRWGGLLAKAVMQAMGKGNSQQVRRFDSPRQFVTAFLKDLIDGRAWSCWYYEEFRVLKRLADRAIVVQLLTARPTWIAPVLQELSTTGYTTRLLERWNQEDIEQLWVALGFLPQPKGIAPPEHVVALLNDLSVLWNQVPCSRSSAVVARARDRLRLWLAFAEGYPTLVHNPEVASLVHALVDLAALLLTVPELAPLLLMESGLYPAIMRRIATGPTGDVLGWLVPLASTENGRTYLSRLAQVASAGMNSQMLRVNSSESYEESDTNVDEHHSIPPGKRARMSPQETDSKVDEHHLIPLGKHAGRSPWVMTAQSSPVGSVFLLLPALVESGYWERWQDELGETIARRYLFIVALKALGRERAPMLLGDGVLATFAGLSEPPVADARLPVEVDPIESGQTISALGTWALALPEVATRWYPEQERTLTLGITDNIQVLRDATADCWLAAWPKPDTESSSVSEACWSELPIGDRPIRRELTEAEQEALIAEALHLQLDQRLGYPWLTPTLDVVLSAVTSFILRRTAARLPRFHRSSPAYLARQFLAQPATLHPASEVLTVRLSGGPLSMVLRLASLPKKLAVPWLTQPLQFNLPGGLSS